ncbi:MAG: DUF1361 domain-containing protein [Candidatus Heteroscillospira sp.]
MKGYARLWLPLVWYGIGCFAMMVLEASLLYPVMFWNVFLAALPLIFILKARKSLLSGRKAAGWTLMVLWLLFLPNALYMPTDMIHITGLDFFNTVGEYGKKTVYVEDIFIWCRLITVAGGMILSMLMGLESMRIAFRMTRKRFGGLTAASGAVIVSWLCALGVYIGRFLRFNSWDILRPVTLIRRVLESLDAFALYFCLFYGLFVIVVFLFYMLLADAAAYKGGEN